MENERDRIVGVKAIANYLDTSVRNVHRWEKKLNLPLHRIGGVKGCSVYVNVEELEEWFKRQKSAVSDLKKDRKANPIIIKFFFIMLIVTAFSVLYLFLGQRIFKSKYKPIMATYAENVIQIKNVDGDILWSYISFNPESDHGWTSHKCVTFFDFNNDGLNEVLARTFSPEDNRYSLILFNHDGSKLWKKYMENEHRFNRYIDLKTDFFPAYVGIAKSKENQISIITYWRHRVRFLCIFSRYNLDGILLDKYSHVGNLGKFEICDIVGDEDPEIIFCGTNNLLNGEAVVGVLPLSGFKGTSPPYRVEPEFQEEEFRLNTYVPENSESGNQLFYIRFKKTRHLEKYTSGQYRFAEIDNVSSKILHITLYPWNRKDDGISFGFYYTMNHELDILDLIPNSILSQAYPDFLRLHEIDISLKEFTTIYSQLVHKWKNGRWIPVQNYLHKKFVK